MNVVDQPNINLGAFEFNSDDGNEEEETESELNRNTVTAWLGSDIITAPREDCYRVSIELLAKMPGTYEFRDY